MKNVRCPHYGFSCRKNVCLMQILKDGYNGSVDTCL